MCYSHNWKHKKDAPVLETQAQDSVPDATNSEHGTGQDSVFLETQAQDSVLDTTNSEYRTG